MKRWRPEGTTWRLRVEHATAANPLRRTLAPRDPAPTTSARLLSSSTRLSLPRAKATPI